MGFVRAAARHDRIHHFGRLPDVAHPLKPGARRLRYCNFEVISCILYFSKVQLVLPMFGSFAPMWTRQMVAFARCVMKHVTALYNSKHKLCLVLFKPAHGRSDFRQRSCSDQTSFLSRFYQTVDEVMNLLLCISLLSPSRWKHYLVLGRNLLAELPLSKNKIYSCGCENLRSQTKQLFYVLVMTYVGKKYL